MKTPYVLLAVSLLSFCIAQAQIEQVTDLNLNGDSDIGTPFMFDGKLFFAGDADDETGNELYVLGTDGLVILFKDINVDPEDGSPDSKPGNFLEYKSKLYFTANDGDNTGHGEELWVTDGNPDSTEMVYDINPEIRKGSNPMYLFVFNDTLYFRAEDGNSTEWWKYGGGDSIPQKATNLRPEKDADVSYPIVDELNNRVFFQYKNNNDKKELCVLQADGTVSPIVIKEDKNSYLGEEAILFDGKLYFRGTEGDNGDELWVSDGTVEGTYMLKDIKDGGGDSKPGNFTILNDKLYFIAKDDDGERLWVTDGTAEGTSIASDPNPGKDPKMDNLFLFNDVLVYTAEGVDGGEEVWFYDGEYTQMLKDINPGDGDSKPKNFSSANGLLFFQAKDESGETMLWVSDGTEANTVLVADLFGDSENPTKFGKEVIVFGTEVYFIADDGDGDELFRINAETVILGTPVSNKQMQESKISVYPNPCNGHVNFSGVSGISDYELFSMSGALIKRGSISRSLIIDEGNGIYILRLSNKGKTSVHRIIVN